MQVESSINAFSREIELPKTRVRNPSDRELAKVTVANSTLSPNLDLSWSSFLRGCHCRQFPCPEARMQGMKHVTTGMYQKSPFSLLTHSCIRIHNFYFSAQQTSTQTSWAEKSATNLRIIHFGSGAVRAVWLPSLHILCKFYHCICYENK